MMNITPSETLAVNSIDTGASGDFEAIYRRAKHELLAQTAANGVYRFFIRKIG